MIDVSIGPGQPGYVSHLATTAELDGWCWCRQCGEEPSDGPGKGAPPGQIYCPTCNDDDFDPFTESENECCECGEESGELINVNDWKYCKSCYQETDEYWDDRCDKCGAESGDLAPAVIYCRGEAEETESQYCRKCRQ